MVSMISGGLVSERPGECEDGNFLSSGLFFGLGFKLKHQVFPFGSAGGQLCTQIVGKCGEASRFRRGDINSKLFLSVCDGCFNARRFFFQKNAALFHLFLLDGIEAAGTVFGSIAQAFWLARHR